jgi:hypothetical protein
MILKDQIYSLTENIESLKNAIEGQKKIPGFNLALVPVEGNHLTPETSEFKQVNLYDIAAGVMKLPSVLDPDDLIRIFLENSLLQAYL